MRLLISYCQIYINLWIDYYLMSSGIKIAKLINPLCEETRLAARELAGE